MTKEKLLEILHKEIITLKFTKTDGSERVMKCTLRDDYLVKEEKKTDRVKKPNDNVISVWDVEFNGWRAFKYDNLLEVHSVSS
jgi:hypothetical protein